MENRMKYIIAMLFGGASMASGYYYPAETFLAFTAGWLFIIPAAFVAYMAYGYISYMRDRKHRIEVTLKPSAAMKAYARREIDLKREKESILFEEARKSD